MYVVSDQELRLILTRKRMLPHIVLSINDLIILHFTAFRSLLIKKLRIQFNEKLLHITKIKGVILYRTRMSDFIDSGRPSQIETQF